MPTCVVDNEVSPFSHFSLAFLEHGAKGSALWKHKGKSMCSIEFEMFVLISIQAMMFYGNLEPCHILITIVQGLRVLVAILINRNLRPLSDFPSFMAIDMADFRGMYQLIAFVSGD